MSDDKITIVSGETIESYFAEIVGQAVQQRKVAVTAEAQFYLVKLLCEFALTDRLYEPDDETGQRQREALALQLARANSAPSNERVQLLKRLGDSSLYISGFFAESLARSLVDVEYYISMGGNAYGSLSATLQSRPGPSTFVSMFAELSSKFRDLVGVVASVSETSSAFNATNGSILRLYDLWVRTGSQRVAGKLRARGLDPAATLREPDGEQ